MGSKKFKACFVVPFQIKKLVGPVACKLDLVTLLKGVYSVFYISLLQPYRTGGDSLAPPEPIIVKGTTKFEVEQILAHRDRRGRAREYLVCWAGHDSSKDLWLTESDLQNAPAVLRHYKATVAAPRCMLGLPPCA